MHTVCVMCCVHTLVCYMCVHALYTVYVRVHVYAKGSSFLWNLMSAWVLPFALPWVVTYACMHGIHALSMQCVQVHVCVHNIIMHWPCTRAYMHVNVVHPCTPPLVISLVHKLHNEAEAVTFENLRIIVYPDTVRIIICMYITRFCGPTCTYVYSKMSCMYMYISADGDRVTAIFIHCDIHYLWKGLAAVGPGHDPVILELWLGPRVWWVPATLSSSLSKMWRGHCWMRQWGPNCWLAMKWSAYMFIWRTMHQAVTCTSPVGFCLSG